MRLTKIYVRFYKSFNYDYERKFRADSVQKPWELVEGAWYPFVEIDLEPSITTVVGANESGKSHLLDSIEKVIKGQNIEMADFCRYSHFFSVTEGQRRRPDFGCEFEVVDTRDTELVKAHLKADVKEGDRFLLFRLNGAEPEFYRVGEDEPLKVKPKQAEIELMLPSVFRIDANIPLPDSIPVRELDPGAHQSFGTRRARLDLQESFFDNRFSTVDAIKNAAETLLGIAQAAGSTGTDLATREEQFELARKLLFDVARIDRSTFKELSEAIADGKDGYANAVIDRINDALARELNFPRWWAQDRDFRLQVTRSEFEAVLTIRDRTGTEYSFGERSSGLKYFLSYHVQLLAHRPPETGQAEILLMDEPDAYLSSQGQQDLLRILEEFALPEDSARKDQVVYVTHSPFLINRNAGDRIRVLDKGATDEGTRVVRDVARNHYEPLRSALGAFVAETSFIGGSNLFVEGASDQVMLAGMSSHLRAQRAARLDLLDLNEVTIVPAGSSSNIPYLVYLARGRDVVRPPCVALLDGDQAGAEAMKALAKGGGHRKEILPKKFIVNVSDWAKGKKLTLETGVMVREPEDLLSIPVAVEAARAYAGRFMELKKDEVAALTHEAVRSQLESQDGSLFDALEAAFKATFGQDASLDKTGFAKEVIAQLVAGRRAARLPDGIAETEANFMVLLSHLAEVLRDANREEEERRIRKRLDRIVEGFLKDFPTPVRRERGHLLLEEVLASLERSEAADQTKLLVEAMRRDFKLDEDLNAPIENYADFTIRVRALRYQERFANQDPVARPILEVAEELLIDGAGEPLGAQDEPINDGDHSVADRDGNTPAPG
jgi:energy-coupling factor transporter ATP-binding protein EcfA2